MMGNNNKILTVSYGTFSCTLEGFEDSFDTMKAIAEYFRDLAADDRYFGAVPPTPDAALLASIAARQTTQAVAAHQTDGHVVLRAQEAAPEAAPDAPPASVAPSVSTPAPALAAAVAAPIVAAATATSAGGSIAERLQRIRAVVNGTQDEAPVASDFSEDQHAEAFAFDADAEAEAVEAEVENDFETAVAPVETPMVEDTPVEEVAATEAEVEDQVEFEAEAEVQMEAEVGAEPEAPTNDLEADQDKLDDEEPNVEEAEEPSSEAYDAASDLAGGVEEVDAEAVSDADAGADDQDIDKQGELNAVVAEADDDLLAEAVENEDDAQDLGESADDSEDNIFDDAAIDSQEDAASDVEHEAAEEAEPEAQTTEAEYAELDADAMEDASTTDKIENVLSELADHESEVAEDDATDVAPVEEDPSIAALVASYTHGQTPRPNGAAAADDVEQTDASNIFDAPEAETAEAEEIETETLDAEAPQEDSVQDDAPEKGSVLRRAVAKTRPLAVLNPLRRTRVLKVKRVDIDKAVADGRLEQQTPEDTQTSSLSDTDEAELLADLARAEAEAKAEEAPASETIDPEESTFEPAYSETEAEQDEALEAATEAEVAAEDTAEAAQSEAEAPEAADDAEDAAAPAPKFEDDVSRLMEKADEQMDEPESAERRSAFQALKAAVAARKADTGLAAEGDRKNSSYVYRSDLAEVVQPRRPEAPAKSDDRPSTRPAPLRLVAEQRVDVESVQSDGPVRPRRVETPPTAAGETAGFSAYAKEKGATELSDLLEAAASYLSFVEGKEQFSRPQLMTKVRQIDNCDFSREDGLRAFGQLLRNGKIEKVAGGRFRVTAEIGYRPDQRAAG